MDQEQITPNTMSPPQQSDQQIPEMMPDPSESLKIEDRLNEFNCPVCFDLIQEASITRCGHTFCYQCILKSINRFNGCPKCNGVITLDCIFPNHLLDELVTRYKVQKRLQESGSSATTRSLDGFKSILTTESQKLSLSDVNQILQILNERKELLEAESSAVENCLLYEFLKELLQKKEEHNRQLLKEIRVVKKDLEWTERTLKNIPNISEEEDDPMLKPDSFNSLEAIRETSAKSSFISRRLRMHLHFNDFVSLYLQARRDELYAGESSSGRFTKIESENSNMRGAMQNQTAKSLQSLEEFRENLVKFSRYSTFRPLATLKYSTDMSTTSTIVSSIVFDKDNEYFAIGGVSKRIKVYDYLTVVNDSIDIHYPCVDIVSNSKISCITWNWYHKNVLAASDYEGAVSIWDSNTGQMTKWFHEHEKRCWSVDFNEVDTGLMVSGSDDARVKLWSLKDAHSIATVETKANVCCVRFNPHSSCHFAFGSADHDVHYYDMRNLNKALSVYRGHRKAVSYVKFLNAYEIVSACTDSELKLWNVSKSPPFALRSFSGHLNEKNFVGLATDRDYIATGSEDNSVYIYYKGLAKPLFSYNLESSNRERTNDTKDFISALCWRKNCNVVLAANSRGVIKILELV